MRSGPAIIGFDGSPAARHALLESAAVLSGQPVLVVVVWEAGRAFDLVDRPSIALDFPVANLDVRSALVADEAAHESAFRLAEYGAALATEAGMRAEGLAVADEVQVADTLVRLAHERDARAVVVGTRQRSHLGELLLGSTSRSVLDKAPCPVVVIAQDRRR